MKPLFKTTVIEILKNDEVVVMAFKKMVKPLYKIAVFVMLSSTCPKHITLDNNFNAKLFLYFF